MNEISGQEKRKLQQMFLAEFVNECAFDAGCRVVQAIFNKAEGEPKQRARTLIGTWLIEDEEFAKEFEKAKRIVEAIRYEEAEDFLNRAGTGRQPNLNTAPTVAAHMLLEGYNRLKWSAKAPVTTKKAKTVPRIEYHDHEGRPKHKKENDGQPG